MAIIVDNDTRLVVAGLTGSEGRFHGLRNQAYGTNLVAGVTPGKGGQDVEGVPIFDTAAEAVDKAGANTSMIFVPARFAADAIYEAVGAGIGTVICITEHIPAHDMLRAYTYLREQGLPFYRAELPGRALARQGERGDHPGRDLPRGLRRPRLALGDADVPDRPRADAARSRQLSTIVGIGGDPGRRLVRFVDVAEKFEADEQTELIVLVGEIEATRKRRPPPTSPSA